MKKSVNKPIAGTFGWLGAGAKEIEIPEETRTESYHLAKGEARTIVIEDGLVPALIEAELAEGAILDLIQIRRSAPAGAACAAADGSAGAAGEPANGSADCPAGEACAAADGLTHTDIHVRCGADAAFHWYRLLLDGSATYDNCSVVLEGDGSTFSADVGYRLKGQEIYDVNCEAIHLGRKTESRIDTSGVLADNASKLMRGTIDFRAGCAGSVGSEAEDVLLMDESVRNQTVPVILCAEEDVVGNHGATIGRPDEKMLYYMESRGVPQEEACEMLARAKVDAVIDKLPDPALRDELKEDPSWM